MEDRLAKGMDEIDFVKTNLAEVKDKNDDLGVKVFKSLEQTATIKNKLEDILGDADSMQAFMANTKRDLTSIKKKLNIIEKQHEKLVEDSDVRLTKNEKILIETEKRSIQAHQSILAMKIDMGMHKKLKNTQYKVIVDEIDQLQDFKLEFNKKCDFLSLKTDNLTALCNQTIDELIKKFEKVQQPILNKVEDLKGVSEMYRLEIERTQKTNRELISNYGKLKTEISEVKREAVDHLQKLSFTEDVCVMSKSTYMDPDISVASSPRGMLNFYYGKSVIVENQAPVSITQDSIVNDTSVMRANSIYDGSHVGRKVVESRRKSDTNDTVADTKWDYSKPLSPDDRQKLEM